MQSPAPAAVTLKWVAAAVDPTQLNDGLNCPGASNPFVACDTFTVQWSGLCIDGTSGGASCQCAVTTQSSMSLCEAECEGTAGCTGFAYNSAANKCYVYTDALTQWTGTSYLAYTCYSRDSCPPPSPRRQPSCAR